MRTKNTIAQFFGRAFQRPLGRTLQLRRTFDRIGVSERMAGVEAPFYREWGGFVCKIRELRGVIPKPRAFTSAERDLACTTSMLSRHRRVVPPLVEGNDATSQAVPCFHHDKSAAFSCSVHGDHWKPVASCLGA